MRRQVRAHCRCSRPRSLAVAEACGVAHTACHADTPDRPRRAAARLRIAETVKDLADASEAITEAVQDCHGADPTCTSDIEAVARALDAASTEVEKAATDCAAKNWACLIDVGEAVINVGKIGIDIAHAVSACKKK